MKRDVRGVLEEYLGDGEELEHWARGVRSPSWPVLTISFLFAALPALIVAVVITRHYAVGLTNRRFLVARVSSGLKVREFMEYPLDDLSEVVASPGTKLRIHIYGKDRPFWMKFDKDAGGVDRNVERGMALAYALATAGAPTEPRPGPLGTDMPLWLGVLLALVVLGLVALGLSS